MTGQAGTLFGEDQSYTLTATSYRRDTWNAERIFNINFQRDVTTLRLYGRIDVFGASESN